MKKITIDDALNERGAIVKPFFLPEHNMWCVSCIRHLLDEGKTKRRELGIVQVPLDKIIGLNSFELPTADIIIKDPLMRDYLENPSHRKNKNEGDPIDLFLYRGKYYVWRNGNHRVILLKKYGKERGEKSVIARVTEFSDV